MYVPIRGFEPDADDTVPGSIPVMDNFIPTYRGMESAPSLQSQVPDLTCTSTVTPALQGGYNVHLVDGTYRTFVACGDSTTSKIWEANAGTWSDLVEVAQDTFAISASAFWTFTSFGNISLAVNKATKVLASTANTFTTLVNAPKASIITSALEFVLVFDTNEGCYGDSPQRWWCSAAGDYTSWTADIATQATTGLLEETPGKVVAAAPRHSEVIAYKERAIHQGRYVGPPFVWSWEVISEEVGTFGPYCVVQARTHHYFPAHDGLYLFDGVRPYSIGENRVEEYFLDNLDFDNADKIIGGHDEAKNLVYWLYPTSSGAGPLDAYLAYNYRSDKWGYGALNCDWFLPYSATANKPVLSVIKSKALQTWDGAPGTTSLRTHKIGEDGVSSIVTRVRPRFNAYPTGTPTATVLETNNMGEADTTVLTSVGFSNGAFDYIRASRWQQVEQTYTGTVEILGFDIAVDIDGLEAL